MEQDNKTQANLESCPAHIVVGMVLYFWVDIRQEMPFQSLCQLARKLDVWQHLQEWNRIICSSAISRLKCFLGPNQTTPVAAEKELTSIFMVANKRAKVVPI